MEINLKKNLLPIGSVVTIRFNNDFKIMITGYSPVDSKTNTVYDYIGVIYPYGISGYDQTIIFNRDTIKRVHFVGFNTDEYNEVEENARSAIEKYNKEKNQE